MNIKIENMSLFGSRRPRHLATRERIEAKINLPL